MASFVASLPSSFCQIVTVAVLVPVFSLLWTDTTGKPGSAESNTLVANIGGTTDKDGKPVNKSGIDVTVVSKMTGNRMLLSTEMSFGIFILTSKLFASTWPFVTY